MPVWPASWRRVYGEEIATPTRHRLDYATSGGVRITVWSSTGPEPAQSGRLIALINLGGRRVAVVDGGAGNADGAGDSERFEARWSSGHLRHALAMEPTTLRDFTMALFALRWS